MSGVFGERGPAELRVGLVRDMIPIGLDVDETVKALLGTPRPRKARPVVVRSRRRNGLGRR